MTIPPKWTDKKLLVYLIFEELARLDERVDKIYFDAKAMIEAALVIDEGQPKRHKLIHILNQAMNCIHWLSPCSEAFYHSAYEAQDYLGKTGEYIEKQRYIRLLLNRR